MSVDTTDEMGLLWAPYQPGLVYFRDSDCFEYVTEDVAVVYDEVEAGVCLLKDIDSREVKGFKVEGWLIRHLMVETPHEGKGADTYDDNGPEPNSEFGQ